MWRHVVLCSGVLMFMQGGAQAIDEFASRSADTFWERREEGFFWYLDPQDEKKRKQPETKHKPGAGTTTQQKPRWPATEQVRWFRRMLDELKARAILAPTEDNLKAYMFFQQQAMTRASVFADQWRRVVWKTPKLNYSLRRPSMSMAIRVHERNRFLRVTQAVREINKDYGIFYFYKWSCPYCRKFSPILKLFEREHGLRVLAVTLDGRALPSYPHPRTDLALARRLGVTTVPSVYLVHLRTNKVITVTNGMLGYRQLQERVYILTRTRPGQEF